MTSAKFGHENRERKESLKGKNHSEPSENFTISDTLILPQNAHLGKIPGISEYIAEFTSEKSFGSDGYLQEKGLIPSPDAERAEIRTNALGQSLAWLADFN